MDTVPPNSGDLQGTEADSDEWGFHPISQAFDFESAKDRALVLLARGIPCRLVEEQSDQWVLRVPLGLVERARTEIKLYEEENQNWPERPFEWPRMTESTGLIMAYIVIMSAFFFLQYSDLRPASWDATKSGVSSSSGIFVHHEYWRALTALFLHGDFAHLASNLLAGSLFIGLLLPIFGGGMTSLALLVTGTLGNFLNASFYREHFSLGASTAVFAAIGLLTVWRLVTALEQQSVSLWRRLAGPLGGGLAFLALLGSAKETDYMAHFWGFLCGFAVGWPLSVLKLPQKTGAVGQRILGLLSAGLVAASWIWAWKSTHG